MGVVDFLRSQLAVRSTTMKKSTIPRKIGFYSGAHTVDQILSVLPKKKLTRDDFLKGDLKEMQEKADHEASLPPEHVPLVNRRDLMGTIQSTWEAVGEAKPDQGCLVQVVFESPQRFSSASLEDLSRSTFSSSCFPLVPDVFSFPFSS